MRLTSTDALNSNGKYYLKNESAAKAFGCVEVVPIKNQRFNNHLKGIAQVQIPRLEIIIVCLKIFRKQYIITS